VFCDTKKVIGLGFTKLWFGAQRNDTLHAGGIDFSDDKGFKAFAGENDDDAKMLS